MSCQHCGCRAKGRYCRDCERDIRRGVIHDPDDPDRSDDPDSELHHRCTACGTEYYTDGSDPCPDCGARRRRYIGPMGGA